MRWYSLLLLAPASAYQLGCSPVLSTSEIRPAPVMPPLAPAAPGAPMASTPSAPTGVAPIASSRPLRESSQRAQASAPASANHPALLTSQPAPDPPAPPVLIEVEAPYKQYHRPRPEGAILAAGEDEKLARWNVGGTGDPDFISNRPGYHPGARVVVNTKLVAGQLPKKSSQTLSQQSLLAQSRSKGYWPLRICYENALRRDPEQSGESIVRLSVARSGRVTRARLRSTKLDAAAGECLEQAVSAFRFRAGPARGVIAADLSVEFWPGDAPVVAIEAPADDDANPGTLHTTRVATAVDTSLDQLRDCYRAGLSRDPELWGRLQLLVELTSAGETLAITQSESRFPDPDVSQCVIAALERVSFPAPGDGPLRFVQAFRFGQSRELEGTP